VPVPMATHTELSGCTAAPVTVTTPHAADADRVYSVTAGVTAGSGSVSSHALSVLVMEKEERRVCELGDGTNNVTRYVALTVPSAEVTSTSRTLSPMVSSGFNVFVCHELPSRSSPWYTTTVANGCTVVSVREARPSDSNGSSDRKLSPVGLNVTTVASAAVEYCTVASAAVLAGGGGGGGDPGGGDGDDGGGGLGTLGGDGGGGGGGSVTVTV
jgi:hypothetical protein